MINKRNNGKDFERNFQSSVQSHVFVYRPNDIGGGLNARFTHESLCDFICYNNKNKNLYLLELKSTVGTSVSFKEYSLYCDLKRLESDLEVLGNITPRKRKTSKIERIKVLKAEIKDIKKELKKAMIKTNQIVNLYETDKSFDNIYSYFIFFFKKTNKTYVLHIDRFYEFWKTTEKKSINENDIVDIGGQLIQQDFVGKSKINIKYELKFLEGEN